MNIDQESRETEQVGIVEEYEGVRKCQDAYDTGGGACSDVGSVTQPATGTCIQEGLKGNM